MQIFNKDNEIISSGTIISTKEDFIEFHIPKSDLKFRFKFLDSKEEGAFSNSEVIKGEDGKDIMEIYMYNLDKYRFTGNNNPLKLAMLNNKELSLKFRASFVGIEQTDVIFHYSWFLSRKEMINGK